MLIKPEKWQPQGIASLEDAANLALKATSSVLVTAGAGAGKSEFLAQKAAYLLQTGLCPAPQRLLAISFKKDAAENLQNRIAQRCSPELARRFDSLTFDAFTKRLYEQFYKALPENYKPQDEYDLVWHRKSDFESYLGNLGHQRSDWKRLENSLTNSKLPLADTLVTHQFWQHALHAAEKSQLSFAMINRLVEYLLRKNPHLLTALRLTYPVVFLDEFQDTTTAQFELLCTAFNAHNCVLTAVGDDKQKIMGWAGAMPAAFDQFEVFFKAQRLSLLFNWRSHPELVELQQRIAKRIDSNAPEIEAKGKKIITSQVSAVWGFENADEKNTRLAEFIATEVKNNQLKAEDFSLLVRSRTDDYEIQLAPIFAAKGLTIRNLARKVGAIDIQELLNQELTQIVLSVFYLIAKARAPLAWEQAVQQLGHLKGLLATDEHEIQRLQQELQGFLQAQRNSLQNLQIEPANAQGIAQEILAYIVEATIRQAIPAYKKQTDFERVWHGFLQLLEESTQGATNWVEVLDKFSGKNQIPLLTIHKSKGLEYHTVILLGFDKQTWWSLKPNSRNAEELNAFFVAITRAQQRLFLARTLDKGGRINWIEELLGV